MSKATLLAALREMAQFQSVEKKFLGQLTDEMFRFVCV